MNIVIQQLGPQDRVLRRRFVPHADKITPEELYEQAFGKPYAPLERSGYGTLFCEAVHADGRRAGTMTRTAIDPHEDMRLVSGALELVSAIKRGVAISPERFYELLVGKKAPRPIVYWVGRFTMFKWRAAVAAADGEVEVVERRLRKQGFPQRIRELILKGRL